MSGRPQREKKEVKKLEDEYVAPIKTGKKRKKAEPKEKKASTKKAKKGLKKDGTPKAARGTSSFMFFSTAIRTSVKEENPDMAFGEIAKEIGAQWHALAKKDKVKYEKMAEKSKAEAAKKNAKAAK